MSDEPKKRGRPRLHTPAEAAKKHSKYVNAKQKEQTRDNNEIGDLPLVKDPIRKSECGESLELFCSIYLPATFYMPFSAMHRHVIEKTEATIRNGGMHAIAMPRGSGKSALARASAFWAILYGYTKYVYFIGANAKVAAKALLAIKAFVWSPVLLDDFPEAVYPLRRLEQNPQKCRGQTYHGDLTLTQWSKVAVVFPTIPGSKASGAVFNVDGITSGFRGADFTHPGGEMLRPGYTVVDDPQTDRSAKSDSMCEDREALIAGAVLGLAGPDKRISALMPCTVIRQGDLADRMLDVKAHPEWNGSRYGLVKSFPADVDRWAAYKEKLVGFNPDIPGDSARAEQDATEFYFENHASMSMGAELTWPERFTPDCLDALQFAMNLRIRDERSFWAEYQNRPVPPKSDESLLMRSHQIAAKLNGTPKLHAPVTTTRLTAGIDVQKNALFWVVCAWEENFTGYVVGYGAHPEQRLPYYRYAELQNTIARATGIQGEEGQIFAALTNLTDTLLNRDWARASGVARVERCLIDSGYQTDLIYQFVRQSPLAALVTPSKGKGVGAKNAPIGSWKRAPGSRVGLQWVHGMADSRATRYVMFDSNFWKSFVHKRLHVAMGNPGCLSLFGQDEKEHRMFADHLTAERPVTVVADGREVEEWDNPLHKDNHFLDALVLCAVGASMQGVTLAGHQSQAPKKRVVFSEMQKAAHERRPA